MYSSSLIHLLLCSNQSVIRLQEKTWKPRPIKLPTVFVTNTIVQVTITWNGLLLSESRETCPKKNWYLQNKCIVSRRDMYRPNKAQTNNKMNICTEFLSYQWSCKQSSIVEALHFDITRAESITRRCNQCLMKDLPTHTTQCCLIISKKAKVPGMACQMR